LRSRGRMLKKKKRGLEEPPNSDSLRSLSLWDVAALAAPICGGFRGGRQQLAASAGHAKTYLGGRFEADLLRRPKRLMFGGAVLAAVVLTAGRWKGQGGAAPAAAGALWFKILRFVTDFGRIRLPFHNSQLRPCYGRNFASELGCGNLLQEWQYSTYEPETDVCRGKVSGARGYQEKNPVTGVWRTSIAAAATCICFAGHRSHRPVSRTRYTVTHYRGSRRYKQTGKHIHTFAVAVAV